jgi:Topoisomerase IA
VVVKTLIIAEKASSAIRIASSLSESGFKRTKVGSINILKYANGENEYYVLPLSGHIIELDFPDKFNDWNIETLKQMVYEEPVKKLKIKNFDAILNKLVSDVDLVIVATDYDREGELIGVETINLINKKIVVKRARFSALTKQELQQSFSNLHDVDYNLAAAAESREIIDLVWGAILTRFFSIETKRLGKNFISVGRVQSPTLAILADKELEIRNFQPEKYYELSLDVNGFKFSYKGNPLKTVDEVEEIVQNIKNKEAVLERITTREKIIPRPIPFNTTEFLKEANYIGIGVERAMTIAEALYQNGKISYPRTDNTVYPRTLSMRTILENLKNSHLKNEIKKLETESRLIPSRGSVETSDHPPIYPVAPLEKVGGDYFKIYDLILRRFLATIAENAKAEEKEFILKVGNYEFSYTSLVINDKGWMKYYPFHQPREKESPSFEKGDVINDYKIKKEEKKTTPPPRYSQGSLVEKMESLNLGTKSTRHEIIKKLYDRDFIEGNPIYVKPLGMALVESLKLNKVEIVEPEMTARLEKDMDKVANGEKREEEVLNESRELLLRVVDELISRAGTIGKKFHETLQNEKIVGKCPKCGAPLIMESTKDKRYIKCIGEANDLFFFLPREGKITFTDERCPDCGLPLIKVYYKKRAPEVRCIDPKCKFNRDREELGKCPVDGGTLVLRTNKRGGRFVGCSNYPRCTFTASIPKMGRCFPLEKPAKLMVSPLLKLYLKKERRKFV